MLTAAQVRRIDGSAVFTATRSPYLVVDDELCIRAVNTAYSVATGRSREALVGVPMFEAFPSNDADPADDGARRLAESFASVFSAGTRHHMGIQRYDIPRDDEPSEFIFKVWTPVNSPLRDDGRTVAVLHHIEDATVLFSPVSGSPDPMPDSAETPTPPPPETGDEWVQLVSALREAREHNAQLRAKCEQLATAVDSNREIGAAIGILMAGTGTSQPDAFQTLVRLSQQSHRKLRDVAADLVRRFNDDPK